MIASARTWPAGDFILIETPTGTTLIELMGQVEYPDPLPLPDPEEWEAAAP